MSERQVRLNRSWKTVAVFWNEASDSWCEFISQRHSHYLAHINPRLCYGAFCLNDSNYRFSPDAETTLLMSLFRLKEEPCLDCPHKRDSSFTAKHSCAARCVSALMRQNESSLANYHGWCFPLFNILYYICCFILANWQCVELAISISSLRCTHGGTDNYQWIHWILMKTSADFLWLTSEMITTESESKNMSIISACLDFTYSDYCYSGVYEFSVTI